MTFLGLKMINFGHFSRFLTFFNISFSSLQHPNHNHLLRISFPVFGQFTPQFECNETQINATDQCSCDDKIFDTSFMNTTIVTEYNLVCSREWVNSALTSITFIGFLFGALVGGYLSDKYGRKRTFTIFFALCLLQTLVLIHVPSLVVFAIWRTVQTGFVTAAYVALQAYAVEIVGPDYKTLGSNLYL